MFDNFKFNSDKNLAYKELIQYTNALISVEEDINANLANIVSMLNYFLEDINWVGFYFIDKNNDLVLSHFNGLPACTRLKLGKGVCAHAFENEEVTVVEDVHSFASHIACDSNSNSEVVVPIFANDKCIGVLDIDSPILSRFTNEEGDLLLDFCKQVVNPLFNE